MIFLVPFAAIGLGLFAVLLIVLLEPFRRSEWRVETNRVASRTSWPLFSLRKGWEVTRLDRLETRRQSKDDSKYSSDADEFGEFELAFVEEVNTDVLTIRGLSLGEAAWMTGVIRKRRGAWFRRPQGSDAVQRAADIS